VVSTNFNPSEKYESQLGLLFPTYGKMFQSALTSHNDYDNNGVINYDNNGYKHHDLPIVSHEIPLGFSW